MDYGSEFDSIMGTITGYNPEEDDSRPLSYSEVLKMFSPRKSIRIKPTLRIKTSEFAQLAYCPYIIWHHANGTLPIRRRREQRLMEKGTIVHKAKEEEAIEASKKLPKATKDQLKDPDINIAEMREMPSFALYEGAAIVGVIDSLQRSSGNLIVKETKSGRYYRSPDHLIQVWEYCMGAPLSLHIKTGKSFSAREIWWGLEYIYFGNEYGPFPFTREILEIQKRTLSFYISLFKESKKTAPSDDLYYPCEKKCLTCAFSYSCKWSKARVK